MDHRDNVVRSFKTICEMLRDRAKHNPESWDCPDLDEVTDSHLRTLALRQLFCVPSRLRNISIVYSLQTKFKQHDVRKLLTNGEILPDSLVILVAHDKPSCINVKSLKTYLPRLQVFELSKLLYNVTRHRLVPLHEVMSDADVAEMMVRFNVKTRQHLPHIISEDPVARYLALNPGQVVRVTRPSPSAGSCCIYRYCVHS
jgi:DNA-directed RNA polymerase subunit H (RpoH/RPB5)